MAGISNIDAYSIPLLINSLFITGFPSSVIATTPADFNSPISDSSSPLSPFEIAPTGYTFTTPSFLGLSNGNAGLELLPDEPLGVVREPGATEALQGAASVPVF